MSSRYMIYWRLYVYAKNLYSISGDQSLIYRDCSPITLRRKPNELRRILDFADRDLSVLIKYSEMKLVNVFEVLEDLLLEVSLSSARFTEALTPHLSLATPQFVHELYNFARSPYDDMISYDCNVQYRARELREDEKYEGSDKEFLVLPGIQSFPDFSSRVDCDECFDFGVDLDVENEDPKMLDSYYNVADQSASMLDDLRNMFNDRRDHAAVMPAIANGYPNSTNGASTSAAAAAAAAAANNNASPTLTPFDLALERALERSMLDSNGNRSSSNNNNGGTPPPPPPHHHRRQHRGTAGLSMPQLGVSAAAEALARNASGRGFGTLIRTPRRPRCRVALKRLAEE